MTDDRTVELRHRLAGNGPPLLLIAGLGLNSNAWARAEAELAQQFTVITVDNRGTGQSPVPTGPYTIDVMAEDIARLLRQLGLGPVAAVGWSLGGSLLQSLLINHGELVSRCVLLSTLAWYTPVQNAWLSASLMLRRNGLDPVSLSLQAMPWSFTPRLLADHQALFEVQRVAVAAERYPTTLQGFEGQAAALRAFDSRAALPSVVNDVLVLVGAEDVLTPPAQSIEIAELIPNARLQIMPRGGHAMVLEYPAETLDAIRAYLQA